VSVTIPTAWEQMLPGLFAVARPGAPVAAALQVFLDRLPSVGVVHDQDRDHARGMLGPGARGRGFCVGWIRDVMGR